MSLSLGRETRQTNEQVYQPDGGPFKILMAIKTTLEFGRIGNKAQNFDMIPVMGLRVLKLNRK